MRCPTCEREMTPLFTSCVCDHCEGPLQGKFYVGYVAWRKDRSELPQQLYVFPTREIAARWALLRELEHFEIRPVLSEYEIRWHFSRGSVRDLELADTVFEVFADHRHPPATGRAFLAPEFFESNDKLTLLSGRRAAMAA